MVWAVFHIGIPIVVQREVLHPTDECRGLPIIGHGWPDLLNHRLVHILGGVRRCGDWHVTGAWIDVTPIVLIGDVLRYLIIDIGRDRS